MNGLPIPSLVQRPRDTGASDLALIMRLLRDYVGRQKLTLVLAIVCMLGGAITAALLAYIFDQMIRYLFV